MIQETLSEYAENKGWSGRGTLTQMVDELERQRKSKLDFVADTRDLKIGLRLDKRGDRHTYIPVLQPATPEARAFLPADGLPILEQAVEQIGEKTEPPMGVRFSKTLWEQRPHRFAQLVDGLWQDGPQRRFIRCLDGQVRAMLSSSYRVLDHHDIAFAALDAVRSKNGEVFEASLSERRMRIKFSSREVWDAVDGIRRGDSGRWFAGGLGNQEYLGKVGAKSWGDLPGGPGSVHPLVTVGNSETGDGGYFVRIGILLGACFNIATVEEVVGRVHLGSKMDVGIYSEQTLQQEAKAVYMQARDAVVAAFDPAKWKLIVAKVRKAQSEKIEAPTEAVENVVQNAGLSDTSKQALLEYFLRDYNQTRFGLAQAVARLAQDERGADQASELEAVAGRVLKGALVEA